MPVTSVTESQETDAAGTLQDVYVVTFTLPPRPGSFTVTVPQGDQVVERVAAAIAAKRAEIDGLFGLE